MNRILITAALMAILSTAAPAAAAASPKGSARTHHSSVARRSVVAKHRVIARVDSRNPVTTALAIAERYWGAVPCGGQIQLLADRPLYPGLSASTDGWATFDSSQGSDDLSAPASTYTNCTITLAHWRWASWQDMESDWGMFCLTVTHEVGHLLGHPHSLVPRSVMAPVFTSDANVPAICNATWLRGWRTSSAAS